MKKNNKINEHTKKNRLKELMKKWIKNQQEQTKQNGRK